jgi:hypothetical protein
VKQDNRIQDKSRIAGEILAYLEQHPEAEDTEEGIAKWWLLKVGINREIDGIRDALEDLEGRSKIESFSVSGKKIYKAKNNTKNDLGGV